MDSAPQIDGHGIVDSHNKISQAQSSLPTNQLVVQGRTSSSVIDAIRRGEVLVDGDLEAELDEMMALLESPQDSSTSSRNYMSKQDDVVDGEEDMVDEEGDENEPGDIEVSDGNSPLFTWRQDIERGDDNIRAQGNNIVQRSSLAVDESKTLAENGIDINIGEIRRRHRSVLGIGAGENDTPATVLARGLLNYKFDTLGNPPEGMNLIEQNIVILLLTYSMYVSDLEKRGEPVLLTDDEFIKELTVRSIKTKGGGLHNNFQQFIDGEMSFHDYVLMLGLRESFGSPRNANVTYNNGSFTISEVRNYEPGDRVLFTYSIAGQTLPTNTFNAYVRGNVENGATVSIGGNSNAIIQHVVILDKNNQIVGGDNNLVLTFAEPETENKSGISFAYLGGKTSFDGIYTSMGRTAPKSSTLGN